MTQLEHALQAAMFAEREGAAPELIAAALLHDVGHLLHELPDDAPDQGVDDRHETLAAAWLAERFASAVVAPVAMHVAAKRYLCAVDADYLGQLSPPSVQSLACRADRCRPRKSRSFRAAPHFADAVRLRRWDDAAKVVGMATPDLGHFAALSRPASEARACAQLEVGIVGAGIVGLAHAWSAAGARPPRDAL